MGYEGEFVRLDVNEETAVGTIRLDRPPMNAMAQQVWFEIGDAALAAEADDRVGAIVVWGGPKVFAAGADIKQFPELDMQAVQVIGTKFQRALDQLARTSKISVAAVNGYALGGGCEVALACDFRVVAENAKMGQPEILLGLVPGGGGSIRLPRLIGLSKAKDLIFSGRMVDANEAVAIGLAEFHAPADETYAKACQLAARYAKGPYALKLAKRLLEEGSELPTDAALRMERDLFAAAFASDDAATGITSFLAHGPGKATFQQR
ncbi:MAG: enoyl-CoA hydratase/carnithine racemase [Nitriliruptoraceae bacterium]|jgi:enoyl-CoA hydratase/carnithine racemase